MAKIGTAPPASLYDGIATDGDFMYLFETQEGLPADGTSQEARNQSPFTLRFVPPEALLQAAAAAGVGLGSLEYDNTLIGSSLNTAAAATSVDLITAASLGADMSSQSNAVRAALQTVSAIGNVSDVSIQQLESFVANGQFVQNQQPGFFSTLADVFTAADISLQLSRMLAVPPLTLLVNPSDMQISYTKIQNMQSRTRTGFVFQAHGEEQPSISFTGSTGGFVSASADTINATAGQVTGQTASPSGYGNRRDSAAWQNFMTLFLMYKNNGYVFDVIGRSKAHLFIGSIAIDYDQWTYVGQMESFQYKIDEESPNRIEFSMDFKVSRMYDRQLASAVVAPQSGGSGTILNQRRSPTALTPGQALGGLFQNEDEGSLPLDILGGF